MHRGDKGAPTPAPDSENFIHSKSISWVPASQGHDRSYEDSQWT